MSEQAPFRPALVIGLVTAGLISFAAFIVLLGWGNGGGGAERDSEAPAVSAVGFEGLIRLAGRFVAVERVKRDTGADGEGLLVVPLQRGDDRNDVQALLQRRGGRATLLILPKWSVRRDPRRPDWVRAQGPLTAEAAPLLGPGYRTERLSAAPRAFAEGVGPLDGMAVPIPDAPQVLHGPDEMVVGMGGEGAFIMQLGSEPHYVAADPDLFNNHGLRRREPARAAVDMLLGLMRDEDGTILFAEAGAAGAAGQNGRNLLRSMFEPPFLTMTLALLVAAVLAGLHGGGRFGPAPRPERAIPFGKAALVENSAGLVHQAAREVRLGGGYADLIRDEAARAGAAPPNLQGEALEVYLDRFTRVGEIPFGALAKAVRTARDPNQLASAARALFRWNKEIIR